jgi:peptide/nickel transport system substrate-binding protein
MSFKRLDAGGAGRDLAAPNPVSRRRFIGGAALSGLAFGHRAFAADEPVKGGKLTMAYTAPVDSLDPRVTYAIAGQQVSGAIFDNLVFDNNGKLEPQLAIAWQAENGAREWVFMLREGVKFHDGRELTSEDVAATLNLCFDKAKGRLLFNALGPLKSVTTEGRSKIRLTFTQPFSEAPAAVSARWMRIMPANNLETMGERPIGTGPFMFKDFQPGSSATIVRNPNYWIPERPYLDEITIVGIADSVTQQAAIRSGNVQVLNTIPTETFLSLRHARGLVGTSEAGAKFHCLLTQLNMPPFDNQKVREAFRYMIDRPALVAAALLGQGVVANDYPFLPTDAYAPPDAPAHIQDLKKARALLDEAGHGEMKLDMWTMSERPPSPKIALSLKEAAAKIGVTINVIDVPYTEYAANIVRKKGLYTTGTFASGVNLFSNIYSLYHSTGTVNYSGMESGPGTDAKLEELMATTDTAKRITMMREINETIAAYSEKAIPYFMNTSVVMSDRVQGFAFPRYDLIDLGRVWMKPGV